MARDNAIRGKLALESLSHRFPQLYVAPADGAEAAYKLAAGRGIAPEGATLDHFCGDEADELREVDTPAGPVETLYLKRREDFETFLRIIGHRCAPVHISSTIGAITYKGLADWGKVASARSAYAESGGDDWGSEFARLARTPGTFRSELIVLSEGPYSAIPAQEAPYGDEEWLRISREIRLHHECAHVVCRRIMPEDILPIWDEITADVVGLLCACEHYDPSLAARFLGVNGSGYYGGRLIEYLDEDKRSEVDAVAREVHAAILQIGVMAQGRNAALAPFDFLLDLKREPLVTY
ncbi:MAG: hypothetical protein UHS51_11890 [Atopobiaceae bacterium]|jgi:hypothetical protein|nr:hypothetical protein [Atopobiaceae bacterium]